MVLESTGEGFEIKDISCVRRNKVLFQYNGVHMGGTTLINMAKYQI
jgi:hypothetical protein